MFKVDLHTHSTASPDGGISARDYKRALGSGLLDCVAVTDHNRIDFALELQAELGEHIIVGEEIMTSEGEIIGLFLSEAVQPNLTPEETIQLIKAQAGLVYVPHPFETVRKGLHPATLERVQDEVDIIEVCNGRAFAGSRGEQSVVWAKLNHKPGAASSDAHGFHGLGKTYTSMPEVPTRTNALELIKQCTLITDRPSLRALLYPKFHRLRKRVRKGRA